jgi:hypothetical protein
MIRRPGLIQVSTPTDFGPPQSTLASIGSQQDNADWKSGNIDDESGDWENKTQKMKEPGFFAKLLESLTERGNKGAETLTKDYSENALHFPEAAEKTVYLHSLSGQINREIEVSIEVSNEEIGEIPGKESNFEASFAVYRSNIEQSHIQNTARESHSPHEEGEFNPGRENSFREIQPLEKNLRDSVSDRALGREEGGRSALANPKIENPEKALSESSEFQVLDKAKDSGKNDSPQKFPGRQNIGSQESGREQVSRQPLAENTGNAGYIHAAGSGLSEQRKSSGQVQEAGRGRRGRINVEFRDLRTGEMKNTATADSSKTQTSLRPLGTETEISVDLKLSAGKLTGETAGKTGSQLSQSKTFEDALAKELRGNLSLDIVRDATIIARNGGEGIIRLSLHPASLGNVKIRLEMTENKITGIIIVESSEALRAFEKELSVLEKAFKDSGFSETNLEMSLAQDDGNFGAGEDRLDEDFSAITPAMVASRYEESDQVELSDWLQPDKDGLILSPERTPVNLLV